MISGLSDDTVCHIEPYYQRRYKKVLGFSLSAHTDINKMYEIILSRSSNSIM